MSFRFGHDYAVTIFGESHQKAVGVTIEGLPCGEIYPEAFVLSCLKARQGGKKGTTPRKEKDIPEILCGLKDQRFDGSALTAIFPNEDIRDDSPMVRPGHADYPAMVRYRGYQDARGGGMFSGRLTLPLTFAGVLAESFLKDMGITITTVIVEAGNWREGPIEDYLESLNGDSCGAKLKTTITGLPAGIGEPFFDGAEALLSHLIFSIPGVKGILFGDALDMPASFGSVMNDCYKEDMSTVTNHQGGLAGGLTNGMPVYFETIFKPTASIALPQKTYDPVAKKMVTLEIGGRHDPCIGLRAVPVVSACCGMVFYDLILRSRKDG